MATITSQWIVSKLITNPTKDFEHGYNSALITILKKLSPAADDELSPPQCIIETAIGKTSYANLTPDQINEFIEYLPNHKLEWVKLYKDIFNVSLVTGKEFADKAWDLYNKNK